MSYRKNINTSVSFLLFYFQYDNFFPTVNADSDYEAPRLRARVEGGKNEICVSGFSLEENLQV